MRGIARIRVHHPRLIDIRFDQFRYCPQWIHGRGVFVIDSLPPMEVISSGRFRYFPGALRHVS
jgi:hypothetical protein